MSKPIIRAIDCHIVNKGDDGEISYLLLKRSPKQLYPNVCSKEHEQSIENVIWFGEDLPYRNTHKNAYSFELSAGQIHKTRPDTGCTAFDYEEEVCERSINNWSSYIKYY